MGTGTGCGIDILEHEGASHGAVADPQLNAVDAVIGGKEELAVDLHKLVRVRIARLEQRERVGGKGRQDPIFEQFHTRRKPVSTAHEQHPGMVLKMYLCPEALKYSPSCADTPLLWDCSTGFLLGICTVVRQNRQA